MRRQTGAQAGRKVQPRTAGYSGTPLSRKLGIKSGHTVAVLGGPTGWRIEDLPERVVLRSQARGAIDVIVAFFTERAELQRRLPVLQRALRPAASLWIAWPRKAAGHVSDISENDLRAIILPAGLVDNKVAALDQDWSALRFVWRRELRPAIESRADRRGLSKSGSELRRRR